MLYRWLRDLHLYFGLFISPFVVVFAASVFFLNHAKVPMDQWETDETFANLRIPDGLESARGLEAVRLARTLLPQVSLRGEIGFTRYVKDARQFVFPVSRPGLESQVIVDLQNHSVRVSRRPTSLWEALAYLHKMPGPHNVAIRGNWFATRAWGWAADATIYLWLFITMSGVYLWYAIKAERTIGITLLAGGAGTFVALVYVINH
jgi:hypothetical protein